MASAVYPVPTGGIKLVQRGNAASAGNITITAIDTTKAFVTFVSQGAAGTVATNSTAAAPSVSGSIGSQSGSTGGTSASGQGPIIHKDTSGDNWPSGASGLTTYDETSNGTSRRYFSTSAGFSLSGASVSLGGQSLSISIGSQALSGGTMDATTKQMGVYIVNSTTIYATGACRWEVVEFA